MIDSHRRRAPGPASDRRRAHHARVLSPEQAAAAAMVAEARARGLELIGPNGLLKLFTKKASTDHSHEGVSRTCHKTRDSSTPPDTNTIQTKIIPAAVLRIEAKRALRYPSDTKSSFATARSLNLVLVAPPTVD